MANKVFLCEKEVFDVFWETIAGAVISILGLSQQFSVLLAAEVLLTLKISDPHKRWLSIRQQKNYRIQMLTISNKGLFTYYMTKNLLKTWSYPLMFSKTYHMCPLT